jgi:hypothetical protein
MILNLANLISKQNLKKHLNGQKTNLLFEAGYALGDVPLTHLYNTSPIILQKTTLFNASLFIKKIVLKRCF